MNKITPLSLFAISICILIRLPALAQDKTPLKLSGEVQQPLSLSVADLQKMSSHQIAPVSITSHKGDFKKERASMQGVLLKDVLAKAEIKAENPKVLSEFYLVARAADGYQVVFSWNELFNTHVGESVYVVYAQGDEALTEYDGPLMLISPEDIQTGRRNVRKLAEISVRRI